MNRTNRYFFNKRVGRLVGNDRFDELEYVLASNMGGVDAPVDHEFVGDIYARSIFIPKGSWITSKIHKTEHPYQLRYGTIRVWDNTGKQMLISAPYTGMTAPGTRRVAYAHTHIIWTTYHANEDRCRDLEELERRHIIPHTNKFLKTKEVPCLGQQ